jgi:hypothetical protein
MKFKQRCGQCRYGSKCFAPRASPRNVVINILACRIRLGIDRNESSKLLLSMIKPQIIRLVAEARARVGGAYVDIDSLIIDLESRVIECLLSEDGYRIGESAYLTEYLFGHNPRTGWVKKWILWGFSRDQRFYKKHTLYNQHDSEDNDESARDNIAARTNGNKTCVWMSSEHNSMSSAGSRDVSDAVEDYEISESNKEDNADAINAIKSIIDDGVTLNMNEYRVISFCLSHANESNKARLIDGTHTYLSAIMSVSRPRITRLYSVAKRKLLYAAQERGIGL